MNLFGIFGVGCLVYFRRMGFAGINFEAFLVIMFRGFGGKKDKVLWKSAGLGFKRVCGFLSRTKC